MGRVLDKLKDSPQKGQLLELVLVDVLRDMGFQGIRRQQSGTQFGFDIAAWCTGADGGREIWKFECKNLTAPVSMYDLAPKLIWYGGPTTIDRFVLVSVSPITNDVEHFLENHNFAMPIEVWSAAALEDIIEASPTALMRLELAPRAQNIQPTPAIYPSKPGASLDVVHELDPPAAFDYVLHEGTVIKAYNDIAFRLTACVSNRSPDPLHIVSLRAWTDYYALPQGRMLTLIKPKGIYEPHKIRFSPRPVPGAAVDLLQGKALRIERHDAEALALLLEEDTPPGLYMLRFEANGFLAGTQTRLSSAHLPLHLRNQAQDTIQLFVASRHYDAPAEEVLRLDAHEWRMLQDRTSDPNAILYVGPSNYEIMHGIRDRSWKIRAVPVTRTTEGFRMNFDIPGDIILELKYPINEDLFTLQESILRLEGKHPWQAVLPNQIRRRCKQY